MHLAIGSSARRPGKPLRLVLIAVLLAGLAGWQGWQCADGAMAAPLAGGHLAHHMPMLVDMADRAGPAEHGTHSHNPMQLGACLSVLAAAAGAMYLLAFPRRIADLLPAPRPGPLVAVDWLPIRAPALSQLCVWRT